MFFAKVYRDTLSFNAICIDIRFMYIYNSHLIMEVYCEGYLIH